MKVLSIGATGPAVSRLQSRLNILVLGNPLLIVDGIFGTGTELEVRHFQDQSGLSIDGIVGDVTWSALNGMPTRSPPTVIMKVIGELGTLNDFVDHVAEQEKSVRSTSALMDNLADFSETKRHRRYMVLQSKRTPLIDFRHFFAAAAESYGSSASRSSKFGIALGGSKGSAEMLGLGNELAQCLIEAWSGQFESCFSPEDLGSNRLGAEFGILLRVKEAEASRCSPHELLRDYLLRFEPLPAQSIRTIRAPGRWDIFVEALSAILHGIKDFAVPSAY